jgi:signal transduction histidine kinase
MSSTPTKGAEPARVAHEAARETLTTQEATLFENLVAEFSTTFVRTTADKIDGEIERWLSRVVVALGLDRATVGEIDLTDGILYATHQWSGEGVTPIPKRLDAAAELPWLTAKIVGDQMVLLSDVEEAPPEAAQDLKFAHRVGSRSTLSLPLKIGGVVVGAVVFDSVLHQHNWSEREVRRLRLVAEVFGNALERKRALQELRRFEEEVRQVSRVAMMGELTVSLAHELNQPLGAILNNAQAAKRMLDADHPDRQEVSAALDDIVRDNSRAIEIVAQVRALFHRGETQKSPVDLKQVMLDVESLLRHEAMLKGISLRLTAPDALPSVVGQRTQLMQLLLNLAMNAFDAVCERQHLKREVEICASHERPGRINVAVRDCGIGLDPKNMPRLFDAFFTTKPRGVGLGLAIARSIVENHGGRLWAVPNPDQGATLQLNCRWKLMCRRGTDRGG